MNAARLVPVLAAALCLSGCAAGDAVGHFPAPAAASNGDPLAALPAAAGRVVGVRRRSYANGFGQEIVLDGPALMTGENLIAVQALTTARSGGRDVVGDELKLGPASDTEIAAEMARLLPGVTMRVAATPDRDAEGAFGYATGGTGRLACVYAWQYVAPPRPVSLFEGLSDTGALPMSVRVRLCREQPVAALLDDLRGLRLLRPNGGVDRAGLRPGGDALAAATGVPVSIVEAGSRPDPETSGLPRLRRHRLSSASSRHVHPAGRPRPFTGRTALHRPSDQDGRRAALVPPVPMPGDVAAARPDALRRAAPAAIPASGVDTLPMPR